MEKDNKKRAIFDALLTKALGIDYIKFVMQKDHRLGQELLQLNTNHVIAELGLKAPTEVKKNK